ncbi:MAG: flagellar assembly protein FliW [Bryobacteraceae bacterium]
MPAVQTRDFGVMDLSPQAFLSFPNGIPGFDREHSFVLIELPAMAPAVVLQSTETAELSFLAIPVSVVDAGYQIGMTPEDLRALRLDETQQPSEGRQVRLLAIVSTAEGELLTVNLLAPIVVHLETRVAVQAVRSDAKYSHCHPLRMSAGDSSCS